MRTEAVSLKMGDIKFIILIFIVHIYNHRHIFMSVPSCDHHHQPKRLAGKTGLLFEHMGKLRHRV